MEVIEPTPVRKAGTLKKLGGGGGGHKNWKDRYFVLAKHLAYYRDQKAYEKSPGDPLGIISLNSFFAGRAENSTNFEFAVHAYPKSLWCRAPSEKVMNEWIETLLEPFQDLGAPPPPSSVETMNPAARAMAGAGAGAGDKPADGDADKDKSDA